MTKEAEENGFLKMMGRRVIGLHVQVERPDGSRDFQLLSAFVVALENSWMLMTAGHAIIEFRDAMAGGYRIVNSWLIDALAGANLPAIPFDIDIDAWTAIYEKEQGIDFAALPLNPMYRANLAAGAIVPLEMDGLAQPDFESFDQVFLVGMPSETVYSDIAGGNAKLCMIPLLRVVDFPEEWQRGDTVLAKLDDACAEPEHYVSSIVGMSGCPVVGLRRTDGLNATAWVIGIQSSWYPDQRVVRFCPLGRFIGALREAVRLFTDRFGCSPGSAVSNDQTNTRGVA